MSQLKAKKTSYNIQFSAVKNCTEKIILLNEVQKEH
jgi:hypothetical protein